MNQDLLLGNVSTYIDTAGTVVQDGEWALQYADVRFGYYGGSLSLDNDVAVLASAFDGIALPADLYTYIENFLVRNGFTCDEIYEEEVIICEIKKSCDYIAPFLPNLDLTFVENQTTFTVSISPSFYLVGSGTTEYIGCASLLTEVPSNENAAFILGVPFFRATTV
jgi:hypothetical protein